MKSQAFSSTSSQVAHAEKCKCDRCHARRVGDRKTKDLLVPPKSGKLAIDTMPLPLKPPGGRT
jgi:hypothetical protein